MARRETVTKVIDGDTFRTSARKHSVRLASVDAPEKGRPGSAKAKAQLQNLVDGKAVRVHTVARDPYRRAVAKVTVDGRSVNEAMKRKLERN